MTIEELSQLSDEELRVKVAEKMGWKKDYPCVDEYEADCIAWRAPSGSGPLGDSFLPDCMNDLNVMHEAEKTLSDANLAAMMRILYWMLIPEKDQYPDHFLVFKMVAKIATASARERAIAFLSV